MLPEYARSSLLTARYDLARAQMRMWIEETSDSVQRRVEADEKKKHKLANELREIAAELSELPNAGPKDVADPFEFFELYQAVRILAATVDPFEKWLRRFLSDHGDFVAKADQDAIFDFIEWVRSQATALAPLARERSAQIRVGIADSAQRAGEVAAEWASVESDGIDP